MKISVRHNFKDAERWLNDIGRKQLPFATSVALNKTASRVRDGLMKRMLQVIDRPTPFTMEAFMVRNSNKRNLTAWVKAKRIQEKYLIPIVFGTTETKTHIVPGKEARLNQYGNLPRRASKGKNTFRIGDTVYKRTGKGKRSKLRVVGLFPNSRSYKKIFDFDNVVNRQFDRWFEFEWERAFQRAMLTAR